MALNFPITADNQGFMSAVRQIRDGIHEASSTVESCGGDISKVIDRIKQGIALLGVATGFKEFTSQVFNTRAEIQSLSISFETLLGNADKANALFGELRKFAVQTPMQLKDLAQGAQTMLGFNIEEDKIMPYLKAIGDISMGDAAKFNSLTLAFSQMSAAGKLMGQDLMQMIGQGFNPLTVIAEKTGKTLAEVKKEMEAGKISVEMVQQAFIDATSEGGKYNGMLEKQSHGLAGAYSNLQGAVSDALNSIGEHTQGLMATTLDAATSIAKNWEAVALILTDIAVAYGVEKAVLAGSLAVETSAYNAEITALSNLIPVKQENINLDVQEALAKGKITEATAAKVIAVRKEHEAYIESLVTAKASATAEAQAAAQKYKAALQQSLAAKAAVEAKRQELIASGQICGAYISENAIKEMGIVTDKAKAASIASVTAKQEYHAAVTKKKLAVDALETAQTNADTVAKNLNAKSTTFLTVAKEGLTKAVKKLYATMMAHPYALILAGVMALGYGIYKLCTYQSDYQKSLSRLAASEKEYNKSIMQEQRQIDVLFGKLQNAKKGTKEWNDAKNAIMKNYGKYLSKLGDEATALKDVKKAYDLVREAATQAAKARALDSYLKKEDDAYIETQADNFEKIKKIVAEKKGETFAEIHAQDIRDIVEGRKKVNDEFLEEFSYLQSTAGNYGQVNTYKKNDLASAIGASVKSREAYEKAVKAGEDRYGIKRTELGESGTVESNESDTHNKEYWEKLKKDAQTRLEALDYIAASGAEGAKIKAEIDKYDAILEEGYSTKKKKSSGKTADQLSSDQEKAFRKVLDLMESQKEERLRLQKEYEYELWQNRIDLMDEGEAKTLAQMELNNSKEIDALSQQKEQAVQAEIARQKALWDAREEATASKQKGYGKKVFNGDRNDKDNNLDEAEIKKIEDRYKKLHSDLLSKQQKAEQDRLDAAKESMNSYLKEFGDYQQKRLAIEEEYETKISEAQNEGERMMLMAQRNKALSDLDYDEWIDTGSVALAFGDISKFSDKTISQLISDMERYRDKVIATFDPDKIQKYEDALSSLRKAQSDESFGIFSSAVPEYFKNRKSTADQMDSAGQNVNVLYEQRVALLTKIKGLEDAISLAKGMGGDTSRLEKDLADANAQLDANTVATAKAKNVFKQLQEQWDKLNTPEEKFYALCDAVASASNLVGGLASQAAEMADAMGAGGLATALGTLGDAMDSVGNIASGFAQGGLVGGIAAAAGEVMKWTTKLFMAGDNRKQKNIERLQEQIDALQKSYEKVGKAADKAFSTDASDLISQQNTMLQQQKQLIKLQIAEEESKKKTDKDKIKEWKETLAEIDETIADNKQKAKEAIIGEDLKSAINEFSSLYAEAWDNGTDAAQKSMAAVKSIVSSALTELLKKNIQPTATKFYDYLAQALERGLTDQDLDILDAYKKEMDALAAQSEEQYKMIQERYRDLDEIKEDLTDISFDSVRDNFKSKLADMSASAKDFTDDWSEMLRNALIDGLMDEKYDLMLREWYDEFAEAMNDKSLTDSERDALRQKYNDIVNQGLADRDFINEIVGGNAYSQEASKGWSTTLTQDQGDELNGRFTAMVELEAINNSLVSEGNMIAAQILDSLRSLTSLSMVTDGDNNTLREIRDMMFLSTGHLEDISKYTKQLITINSGIEKLNDLINKRL